MCSATEITESTEGLATEITKGTEEFWPQRTHKITKWVTAP